MGERKKNIFRIFLLALSLILLLAAILEGVKLFFLYTHPIKYSQYVEEYSREYELDINMVYAVIKVESRFDPDAVSSKGALGLMQITPDTFRWAQSKLGESLEEDRLYDPQTNIKYGCKILRLLYNEFKDEELVLAAYHAGWGSVKDWLKNPKYSSDGKTLDSIPFDNTNSYVKKVSKSKLIYDRLQNYR